MDLGELKPKSRFDNRAENYDRYRPSYPKSIINFLEETIGFSESSIIADIGSGTGISTKIFLDNGNKVYAVEPNNNMRQLAEKLLSSYSNFYSIAASSENTNLQSDSIDYIVAAQSLHWFDTILTRSEFLRILKRNGYVVVLYNTRKASEGFMAKYLELIRKYGMKYINESNDNYMTDFFGIRPVHEKIIPHSQTVDFKNLKGNLISYSYMPTESDVCFIPMIKELENLFAQYNKDGKVILEYDTCISYCKMK
ncbi:hypothetical protein SDC9_89960 [bioreactor metagenome]|uniref:Methyltransferase type 11 domain-containing protein n=1 Tax=bioreactor metagenome TaxID=1076179 RepID=A0A644ZR98_9ZZZZ